MTSPLIGGYDPDLRITLSVRQDFILLLRLKADDDGTVPNIHDIFPAGTTISVSAMCRCGPATPAPTCSPKHSPSYRQPGPTGPTT